MEQTPTPTPPPQEPSPPQPTTTEPPPAKPPSPPHHHQPQFTLPPSTVPSNSSSSSNPPFHRPWDHHQTHIRHFTPPPGPNPAHGGMAIGVPAHQPGPTPQPITTATASTAITPPAPFSSLNPSFRQQFSAGQIDSGGTPSAPQVRQPIQGNQGMGMRGPMDSGSLMRPGGMTLQHQQRPPQPSLRPQNTPSNQPMTSQNLQGHGNARIPSSIGPPSSPSPGTSQAMQQQPHNQPWLSSGAPAKPALPTPSSRPQINPQSLQQRSHIPHQLHHSVPTTSQMPPTQHLQQPSSSQGPQENHGQQFPPPRILQSVPHQQQVSKGPGVVNTKPTANPVSQPSIVSVPDKTASPEINESCKRIINKRSIQELVAQVDPSERLDPEVEDILVDIAEEFVESITTSGCLLAKHRKSSMLEAKDILLHLDRNWNMTLPGFGGDEIKVYKKPFVHDIHKERLAAIRKSATLDTVKASTGQVAGNAKSHLTKGPPANVLGSPEPKAS